MRWEGVWELQRLFAKHGAQGVGKERHRGAPGGAMTEQLCSTMSMQ